MYVCSELSGDLCLNWVELSLIPALTYQDAIQIGGAFLAASATLWGISLVAKTIYHRI